MTEVTPQTMRRLAGRKLLGNGLLTSLRAAVVTVPAPNLVGMAKASVSIIGKSLTGRVKVFAMGASFAIAPLIVGALPASAGTSAGQGDSLNSASSGAPVMVTYQGRRISYAELNRSLGATYCDDFLGYGRLRCYSSARAMEVALYRNGGYDPHEAALIAHKFGIHTPYRMRHYATSAATPAASSANTCYLSAYMVLYTGKNATGSSVSLFCNYPNLGAIAWGNLAHSMAWINWSAYYSSSGWNGTAASAINYQGTRWVSYIAGLVVTLSRAANSAKQVS